MSVFDMVTNLAPATAIAADLQDDWHNALVAAAATKIKTRWDAVVGTESNWTRTVADASNAAWKDMVAANFRSKAGRSATMIKAAQLRKLTRAFGKAKEAHDAVFAGGGTKFIEAVDAKQAHWTDAAGPTLGMTGYRLSGLRGPASIHARAAAGDSTFLRDLPGGVGYTGVYDPIALTPPEIPYINPAMRGMFKAGLEGKLIQVGVFILNGDIPDPAEMNAILDVFLTGFMNQGQAQPPTSYIHFEGTTLHTHLDNNGVLY